MVFFRDTVILIKHMANYKLIPHHNQAQINYDKIRENKNSLDHNYQVRDRVIIRKIHRSNMKPHIRYNAK